MILLHKVLAETGSLYVHLDWDVGHYEPAVIAAMNRNAVAYVTIKAFGEALRPLLVERQEPSLQGPARLLSATQPFPFSRPTVYDAAKCIYNWVPSENEFERTFAKFLQGAPEVAAFVKLPDQFGFSIEYTDTAANLRLYYPDFVARLEDGAHWLLETKGQENIDVVRKDAAATLWCENASLLGGIPWRYLKVPQKAFASLQPADFADLLVLEAR